MPEFIPDNLPYTPPGIECLRLGARRGGDGIGCCAIDVFQGFTHPPDAVRPDVLFRQGDTRTPVINYSTQKAAFITGTNEEHFLSYLRHGTMDTSPQPDHAFFAVLTDEQVNHSTGRAWLKILKREGFVWVGATSNSVYAEYHPNHIFMLIRSTTEHMDDDEVMALKEPPQYWQELEEPETPPAERFYELRESLRYDSAPEEPRYVLERPAAAPSAAVATPFDPFATQF